MKTNYPLDNAAAKHILIIGDVMIDEHVDGSVSRISPEAPVPVVLKKSCTHTLGGAGNVAVNVKSLGCKVTLATVLGNDNHAEVVEALCKEKGITLLAVRDRKHTTVKSRVFSQRHHLLRVDTEETTKISDENAEKLVAQCATSTYDAVLFSDYAKGCLHEKIVEYIVSLQITSVADPKPKHIKLLGKLDYVFPNFSELCQLADTLGVVVDPVVNEDMCVHQLVEQVQSKVHCDIVCTRSEKGISYVDDKTAKFHTVPTIIEEVFDVTGAGDSSIAAFTAALACGWDMHSCVVLANAAGHEAVRKIGVYAPEVEDLLTTYENMREL